MNKVMIGITGGIGSGKSTVCRIFECLGIPVFYSDMRAKKLIHSHPVLISFYCRIFGDDIYENGVLDSRRVASIIFSDNLLLKEVESAVHPLVNEDFREWAAKQSGEIVFKEAAILFESGGFKEMDDIISVVSPESLRINRVMRRDGVSESDVIKRMRNQWNDERRIALSRYIIYADDEHLVIPQVLNVWHDILNRCKI